MGSIVKNIKIMNTKFKVALLTLLGFSASACCGTKKVAKEQDIIINEDSDPRIQLMYGVPFPDGSIARPVDENGQPLPSPRNGAKSEGAKDPEGRVVIPVPEEDVKEASEEASKEQIHDEEPDEVDMVLE